MHAGCRSRGHRTNLRFVRLLDDNGRKYEIHTQENADNCGERSSQKNATVDGYERVERATGMFLRRFTLPESADAEAIKATHVNGVLELSIPKRPQEQPRRIAVQAA